jgi:hypothetical protein
MSLIGTYLTSKHCRECPLSGGKAWFRKSMVIQIVGDRLVDPALEITVARFKKIIALQRAGRRNPMTHENAEDLTANVLVGRSLRHRSTLGFARHRSYGRATTMDKIAHPMGNPAEPDLHSGRGD